jgi:hypothetical protein
MSRWLALRRITPVISVTSWPSTHKRTSPSCLFAALFIFAMNSVRARGSRRFVFLGLGLGIR